MIDILDANCAEVCNRSLFVYAGRKGRRERTGRGVLSRIQKHAVAGSVVRILRRTCLANNISLSQ